MLQRSSKKVKENYKEIINIVLALEIPEEKSNEPSIINCLLSTYFNLAVLREPYFKKDSLLFIT